MTKYARIVKYENGFYWLIDSKRGNAIDGDKRKYVVKEMAKRWGYTIEKDKAKIGKQTPKDKKRLLVTLIELEIFLGYDISNLVGKQLYQFNWDGVMNVIELRKQEYKKVTGTDYGN